LSLLAQLLGFIVIFYSIFFNVAPMFFLAVIDAIQILDDDDDDDDDDDEYYFRFMFNYFNVFGDHFSLGRVIPGGPGLPNKKL